MDRTLAFCHVPQAIPEQFMWYVIVLLGGLLPLRSAIAMV